MSNRRKQRRLLDAVPEDIRKLRPDYAARSLHVVHQTLHPIILSDRETVSGYFDRAKGVMIKFCVRYSCEFDGHEVEVVKIDASPTEAPNIHVNCFPIGPVKSAWRPFDSYATALHEAIGFLRAEHAKYRDAYESAYANRKNRK